MVVAVARVLGSEVRVEAGIADLVVGGVGGVESLAQLAGEAAAAASRPQGAGRGGGGGNTSPIPFVC